MKNNLLTKVIGQKYIWKEEIDSTNDELKRLAKEGAPHGTVVAAGKQTNGKGRRGRVWESPKEDNIYMSILLRPEMEPQYVSMITLVTALAVAKAVEKTLAGQNEKSSVKSAICQIKWPNDLVLNKKKICGILTEMSMDANGGYYVIVGIGINVNTKRFPEEIAPMATSLGKELGMQLEVEPIIASVLKEFEKYYDVFCDARSLAPILETYNARLANAGQQVQILSQQDKKVRFAHGIDETGALLVSGEDGKIEKIISGEVSVRGLYGYV